MNEYICAHCGKTFTSSRPYRRWCDNPMCKAQGRASDAYQRRQLKKMFADREYPISETIPPFDFDADILDSERLDWIRDLIFEYAEHPEKRQYMMDQILRLTCGSEDLYDDAIEAGMSNEWKTE